MGNSDRKPGLIKRLWKWWRTPSRLALGTLLLIGFVGGIVFWGGFNTGMEKANTEEFCISCHEMRNTVYQEYMDSVHYNNRSGVRARSEEHTSELQSRFDLVCRLLLEKKKEKKHTQEHVRKNSAIVK